MERVLAAWSGGVNGQVPEMPGTFREATSGVVEKLIARGF